MGSLKRFNLRRITKEFGTKTLFETGTWKGDSVEYALNKGYERILSTEIMREIALTAKERFKNATSVTIINSSSTDGLNENISALQGPVLFWLDAHYPGAEEGLREYNEEENESLRYPLKKELEIIAKLRTGADDVILIDDLRIYENGNFKNGNLPPNIIPPKERNIDFIKKLFVETHQIIRLYRDEGYILLLPKSRKTKLSLCEKFFYEITALIKGYNY